MAHELRVRMYEFLATPAHIWLWLVARLVGGQFTYWQETTGDDDRHQG